MPILIACNDDSPLNQGDILINIPVFVTGYGGDRNDRAKPDQNIEALLVLSRPCNCLNKDRVIVAGVRGRKDAVPKAVDTYQKAKEFLGQIRDGFEAPDRFYLGQIPTLPAARYYAHLDSLFTIQLPVDDGERSKSLLEFRRARLTEDFRRDLHLRFFLAFADLGFEDITWHSDADLNWLEAKARERFSELEQDANAKAARVAEIAASGAKSPQQSQQAEREKQSAEVERDQFKLELESLSTEIERRSRQ